MRDVLSSAIPPLLGALLGGTCVGLVESLHLLGRSFGTRDYSGIIQAVLLYGGAGLVAGAILAVGAMLLAITLRAAPDPSRSWTVSWIAVFCGGGFLVARVVGARDFASGARLPTETELALLCAALAFAVVSYLFVRNALKKTFFSFLLHPAGTGAVYGGLVLFTLLFALGTAVNNRAGDEAPPRPIAPSLGDRPNLLLLAVRDLDLDALDDDELERAAPTLARLKRESIRYLDVTAHSPRPSTSFASLLTSRVPCAQGDSPSTGVLAEELDSVGEVLSRHGYSTAAFVTDHRTSTSFNFGQGFDTLRFLRPRWLLRASEASYPLVLHQAVHRALRPPVEVAFSSERYYQDAVAVAGTGVDWLRRHGGERWFLTLQFADPGLPLVEHPSLARVAPEPTALAAGGGGLAELDRESLYRGELAWLDRGLAGLIGYMEEHGLLDNTAIVLTGVRGPSHRGGRALSDERITVPLLLRLPDSDAESGRLVGDPVRLLDVAPTLAALAGAPEGAGWQGVSLLREYALRSWEQQVALLEATRPLGVERGLRDGHWKLVRRTGPDQEDDYSLWFLDEDPAEGDNLAGRDAARWKLEQKRDELERLEDALCVTPVAASAPRTRSRAPLSAEDCEVLRRLGYPEGFSERCASLDGRR